MIILFLLTLFLGSILTRIFNNESPRGLLEREIGVPNIIQGNSLMPISPLYIPITRVYASLMADKIIQCESNWNNSARGKAGEIGIAQFKPQTWKWMSELSGLYGDIYNEEDQLKLLEWALENKYSEHWTCFRKLTN